MRAKKVSISALSSKAERALQSAVRQVVKEHKRTGKPVVVWRAGKVVRISANQLLRQS